MAARWDGPDRTQALTSCRSCLGAALLKFAWSGGRQSFLDEPSVEQLGPVAVGRYGGSRSAGAHKNEDGALVWRGADWTLAIVLDGHAGSRSVEAVLDLLAEAEPRLVPLCDATDPAALPRLQQALIELLTSAATSRRMAEVRGETACLICYQRGAYLLWLSVGDNTLYLLHPEFARLGQFTLTVRNFFEWIGERSSLAGSPPCFSTGIRQLRQGKNTIVLATDGIQELPTLPYEAPSSFAATFDTGPAPDALQRVLDNAHALRGKDSCTLLVWEVDNPEPALMPSG